VTGKQALGRKALANEPRALGSRSFRAWNLGDHRKQGTLRGEASLRNGVLTNERAKWRQAEGVALSICPDRARARENSRVVCDDSEGY
jgi:hypothetical protein